MYRGIEDLQVLPISNPDPYLASVVSPSSYPPEAPGPQDNVTFYQNLLKKQEEVKQALREERSKTKERLLQLEEILGPEETPAPPPEPVVVPRASKGEVQAAAKQWIVWSAEWRPKWTGGDETHELTLFASERSVKLKSLRQAIAQLKKAEANSETPDPETFKG